jgi:hypothetical protein
MSVKAGWQRGEFLMGFSGLESQLGNVKEGYRLGEHGKVLGGRRSGYCHALRGVKACDNRASRQAQRLLEEGGPGSERVVYETSMSYSDHTKTSLVGSNQIIFHLLWSCRAFILKLSYKILGALESRPLSVAQSYKIFVPVLE